MKASSGFRGWQPLVGVLAVGVLTFGWSIAGAAGPLPSNSASQPPKGGKDSIDKLVVPSLRDDGSVKTRGVEGRVSVGTTQPAREYAGAPISQDISREVRLGKIQGDLPILPPEIVNPFDDEFTIARQKGIVLDRKTGLPVGQGGAASVQTGCSFDIDCDDCNPCTDDFCNINAGQPLGSGTCSNTPLPDGSDGGCSDGLCCNGRETCQGGVCEAPGSGTGTFDPTACQFPCSGGQVCDEFDNLCKAPCATNADCDDHLVCNGTEICSTGAPGDPPVGVCKRGNNPCGDASATCGEKKCSQIANNPPFCSTDADCTGGGTCTVNGPICFPGRCCLGLTEPTCSRRAKSITFQGVASCNSVGGIWYPGDHCDQTTNVCTEGDLLNPNTGATCPTGTSAASSVKCPKYGAGIAPITNFATDVALVVGPFSRSATCDHFDIGDDYTFSNNSFMAVDHLRWIGAGGGRLVWEFRDASGNLIEDAVSLGVGGNLAIRTLLFSPPITVPPNGYVVVRPAPQFAPNGRTFIAATDVVDIGSNDANALWFDGAIHTGTTFIKECVGGVNDGGWCDPVNAGSDCPLGTCTARNQILAIELEGAKTTEPLGACCNENTGACSGNDRWICEGNSGNFLGQGTFCNSCSAGTTLGANCSRCVGGANINLACQRDSDCPGSTCAANNASCANRCTGGTANGAPCLLAGDCPGGTCTIGGNPGSVCNANSSCGTGACCNTTTGACTQTTPGACVGGTFQGFGSDCDADDGHDNGKQSCCNQPQAKYCNGGTNNHGTCTTNANCPGGGTCSALRYPGGDNCQDAIVQNISVAGTTFLDPVVVTITGDNSTASGQDTCGDAIFDVSGGPGADPGWWEAFHIDGCAFVRVDFCCSSPTVEPQWSFMYTSCPCNSVVPNTVDPNENSEASVARGKPYCGNDDNLWIKFGPLPADTYYIPVYSVLAGHHGPYQMHITAYACPTAACCAGASCSVTDILNCQNTLQGTYLGPPNLPSATTNCDNTPVTGTCGTGSCCIAPGQCKDQIPDNGAKATLAACNGLGGTPVFHGGIRCKGGTCSNDANKSCNSDADCPGGGCLATETQASQPSPCPACDIDDNAHCQKLTGTPQNELLSDYCVADCVAVPANGGLFVADDFVATVSGTLNKVCFAGAFLDQDTGLGDCSGSNPPEKFEIAIYGDHGVPDENNLIGRTSTHVVAKAQKGIAFGSPYFQWQVSLDNPIALVSGTTYWISVINNTNKNFGGTPGCDWFWAYSDASEGNHYKVFGQDQNWTSSDVTTGNDESFCLNINNSVPAVPTKACCACTTFANPSGSDPHCKDTTAEDCATAHGDWLFGVNTCGNTVCQAAGFPGDNCSAAIAATGDTYSAPFNNFCANTDGPVNLTCEAAATRFGNDIWYKYTASCTGNLTVETCDNGGEFDTVMAVYHSAGVCVGGTSPGKNCNVAGDCTGGGTCPPNPNVCGCPPASNLGQFHDCNDDGCVFSGAGSQIVPFPVVAGECYTIRIAGFASAQGHGTFHATCGGSTAPPDVTPNGGEDDKVRYLGFHVPTAQTAAGETAIRVQLVSLMHPNPPNLVQFPPPNFTAFEGQYRWVGAMRFAECIGGTNAGSPCTAAADCPGGSCSGSRCVGGANIGLACTSNANCPSSTCAPSACQESETPATFFMCAPVVCSPHYEDFAAHANNKPLYIYGQDLVPSSTFMVSQLASSCQGSEGSCAAVSAGVQFKTQRWGDVAPSYQLPSPAPLTQPNISDVSAIVDKFKSVPNAIIRARGDLVPNSPDNVVNISDVAGCVDAFKNLAYVLAGPQTCP